MVNQAYFLETVSLTNRIGSEVIMDTIQGGGASGRIDHGLFSRIALPIQGATNYLRELGIVVDDPHIGREPQPWNVVGRYRTWKANRAAQEVLNGVSEDALARVHDYAQAALADEGGLERAFIDYSLAAEGIRKEGREQMTEEERRRIQPIIDAMEAAAAIEEIHETLPR